MMAEKAQLFIDHRAVELIMSSSDSNTHKRVGRGVRNFATAVWDRKKQSAVSIWQLCQICAKPSHP